MKLQKDKTLPKTFSTQSKTYFEQFSIKQYKLYKISRNNLNATFDFVQGCGSQGKLMKLTKPEPRWKWARANVKYGQQTSNR